MFEGLDMSQLMAQAQQLQADMQRAQEEMAAKTFEGSSGGDLVVVTISGAGDLVGVEISPQAWDPDDTDVLSELIIAAFRAAKAEADSALKNTMPAMPQLPEGLGF